MADVSEKLMASIRAELADVPPESVRPALEYYAEYIAEAVEAGRTAEEILTRLGGMSAVVAQVRAEATLSRAETRPGPFRMIGAGRQVFRGIAGGAARLSLMIGASIPYTLTLGFYLLAGAALLAAVLSAMFLGYGITTMPKAFIMEKISVAGAAVFMASFLTLLALVLWRVATGISRLTLRILRKGLRRYQGPDTREKEAMPRKRRAAVALMICAVAALLGIGALFSSSLPLKLFSIWNSQRPASLAVLTWSYSSDEVREIEVATLNTSITLEPAATSADEIRVTYEKPEWLAAETSVSNGKLTLMESSSGTVPFMDLVAAHPGTTTMRIEVPRRYLAQSVTVTTRSGSIRFVRGPGSYRIRASAPDGVIIVQGKVQKGTSYEEASAGRTVDLRSMTGTVEIE